LHTGGFQEDDLQKIALPPACETGVALCRCAYRAVYTVRFAGMVYVLHAYHQPSG